MRARLAQLRTKQATLTRRRSFLDASSWRRTRNCGIWPPSLELPFNMKKWQQYQQEAASFFRQLGLQSTVDARVEGTRGVHDVDVYVTGSLHGIRFTWIVECKAWRSNIPKEKVMALAAIVDDTGADRGFLLSEVGFQSGAIHQAAVRNITLTSIRDLRETVNKSVTEQALARLAWRAARAKEEIWRRHYEWEKYRTEFLISAHWFNLNFLLLAFDEGARRKYPVYYRFDTDNVPLERVELYASNVDELLAGAELVVATAEAHLIQDLKNRAEA